MHSVLPPQKAQMAFIVGIDMSRDAQHPSHIANGFHEQDFFDRFCQSSLPPRIEASTHNPDLDADRNVVPAIHEYSQAHPPTFPRFECLVQPRSVKTASVQHAKFADIAATTYR